MSDLQDNILKEIQAHEAGDAVVARQLQDTANARGEFERQLQAMTLEKNTISEAYAKHMIDQHPPVKPPYSTLFGLGGGNTARNDVDLDRRYYGPGDLNKMLADTTANETKNVISWNSSKFPYTWAEMAKGAGDDWARGMFKIMNEAIKPLLDDPDAVDEWWWSGHHEPEGDQDEDDWRITQDRLSRLVPGGVDGPLKFWLTTTGWNQEFNTQREAAEVDWETNLYPHGAPIYGIAYDAPYNTYGLEWLDGKKTTKMNNSWTDPNVYVDALAKRGVQFGVEVALGEWGYSDEAFAKDRTWAAKVMDRCITNPHKRLRGAAYFDTPLNSKRSWTLGPAGSEKRVYMREQMLARRGKK